MEGETFRISYQIVICCRLSKLLHELLGPDTSGCAQCPEVPLSTSSAHNLFGN